MGFFWEDSHSASLISFPFLPQDELGSERTRTADRFVHPRAGTADEEGTRPGAWAFLTHTRVHTLLKAALAVSCGQRAHLQTDVCGAAILSPAKGPAPGLERRSRADASVSARLKRRMLLLFVSVFLCVSVYVPVCI